MKVKKMMILMMVLLSSSVMSVEAVKKTNAVFDKPIIGTVLEKINASSYSYLKLKTATEDVWIAVPQLEIALNTKVELMKPMPMFGFESKTLKRKFDRLYFGVLKTQKEEYLKEAKKNQK